MSKLIKEIVEEIKKAEAEAEDTRAKSRDAGSEIIRKASKKADHILNSVHKERKGIIQSKVDEAEKTARKESKAILREAETEAGRVENEARKNIDDAIRMVYERVTRYGN